MNNLPSREKYQTRFSRNHLSPEQREKYRDYRYQLCISLDLTNDVPLYTSLKISTYQTAEAKDPASEVVIINCHLNKGRKTEIKSNLHKEDLCFYDLKHLGELLFILAAKLTFDLIKDRKFEEDHSGFLHTEEIKKMNPGGQKAGNPKTHVGKSVYGTLRKLYNPKQENNEDDLKAFVNAFLFDPEQLYHLVCYIGSTDPHNELLFWWLNISANDISFRYSNDKIISKTKLKDAFGKLFGGCLLDDEKLPRMVRDAEAYILDDQRQGALIEAEKTRLHPVTKHAGISHSSPFMPLEDRLKSAPSRYPSQKDFDSGAYYCNEPYHQEIINILKKSKRCLIIGTPGCGKTSLALAIGHDLLQEDITVHYHDATAESNPQEWTRFIESCDENSLVILDNAHANPAGINNLLSTVLEHKTKLLITSRKVDSSIITSKPRGATHGISYLDILKPVTKELQIDEAAVRHIINQATKTSESTGGEIGNIELLIEKCKGDYNILRFYIQAWQRNDCAVCLSDVNETEIFHSIYHHYLENKPYRQELLKISALSQLEIDVDLRWIGKKPSEELQKEGLILARKQTIEPGRYVSWLRVYHPTVAEYFLKAAAYNSCLEARSTDEFTSQSLADYLGTSPYNVFRVFNRLYRLLHTNEELYKIIDNKDLHRIAERSIQQETAGFVIFNRVPILEYFVHRYSIGPTRIKFPHRILTAGFPIDKTTAFYKQLGSRKLGELGREDYNDIRLVGGYIDALLEMGIPGDEISPFYEGLDFQMLGKRARKDNMNQTQVRSFLNTVKQVGVPNDRIRAFCEAVGIDPPTI